MLEAIAKGEYVPSRPLPGVPEPAPNNKNNQEYSAAIAEDVAGVQEIQEDLKDLKLMSKKDSNEGLATTSTKSYSRPLTIEDDDIDLDLEIDENIDTSVSFNFF